MNDRIVVNWLVKMWFLTGSMDKEDEVLRQLQVERPLYEQSALNRAYNYEKPKSSCEYIFTVISLIIYI